MAKITNPNSMDRQSRDFIVVLFRGRCVICNKPGGEVNEIVPRSRSKNSVLDWKNRVLMCHKHHRDYHDKGVSREAIATLREQRVKFLIAIGREEFV